MPVTNRLDDIAIYATPPERGPIDGFSYAGLKIVNALNNMGITTPWMEPDSPASISFCQPHWYSQAPGQFRVGYTPWESTVIPEYWLPLMDGMDLLWTTSNWCREVFLENKVKNEVLVVPHGIDPNEWTIAPRKLGNRNRFTFFHMGEPATRKNGQMVLDAFIKVFDKNPNVYLTFKANKNADVRLREPFGPVTKHPRINLITDTLPVPALNSLYHNMECMVYPSNAEGFGMIPFQAIATGMPTLLVNWGGMAEFGEYGIPIDYKVNSSGHDYHLGEWAHPELESICEMMEEVYLNYARYAQQAYENGLQLRARFDWNSIMNDAVEDLKLRIKF